MAVLTATDYSNQIVAQCRVLDPSFSGEIGTPERKIIDAVAQALAENQVDLTGLAGALDIDSKYGSNLDRFTALFGFQRQASAAATGFVVFECPTPATTVISVPQATVVQASTTDLQGQYIQYTTQASAQIAIGQTQSSAVPVTCTVTGSNGNVAANIITMIVGTVPPGVTGVYNPNALTNGIDQESDNALKTRFKNTWARNLAGTQSQYLAIAVSSAYTTMANVIGSQSRYQEYIQVPDYDDAGYLGGSQTLGKATGGVQNQWTTALSDIPYAKQIYSTTPAFVQDPIDNYFYRPGTDFQFNPTALVTGDLLRDQPAAYCNGAGTIATGTTQVILTNAAIQGFPPAGAIYIVDSTGNLQGPFAYTGISVSPNEFTGVNMTKSVTVAAGSPIYLAPQPNTAPNFTLLNVTTLSNTAIPGLQALAPSDIVLSEFSYISTASRNDLVHGVTNAVDMYINGSNDTSASCVFLRSNAAPTMVSANPQSPFYYENFRRYGSLVARPHLGNYITPLFNTPLDALPPTITINNQNYYLNVHYWLVTDVGPNAGSIRARDGIEWSATIPGDSVTAPLGQPTSTTVKLPAYGGASFPSLDSNTPITVNGYLYDANVVTVQANVEASRQITTDALVHRATTRYFQLDVTVMYSSTANPTVTNASISAAVSNFFSNQPFGAVIQLSDLLAAIANVAGVDNVRWSNDLPIAPDAIRILETDSKGNPLHGVHATRLTPGTTGAAETQTLYIAGGMATGGNTALPFVAFGVGDSFNLSWVINGTTYTTAAIPFSTLSGSTILNATNAVLPTGSKLTAVTFDARPTGGVVNPLTSYTLTYAQAGAMPIPTVTNNVTASTFAYDGDFFLMDNQLPAVPAANLTPNQPAGVTVRVRAQNTWLRPGLG